MEHIASVIGFAPSGMGSVLAMRVRSTSELGCRWSLEQSMSREQKRCWA